MSATPCCHKVFRKGLTHNWFRIYRCKDCQKLWCHKCGTYGDRCASCGSKSKQQHSTYTEV